MTFFLERPYWLILIFVLIPLWLHWRKGLTRQSRLRAYTLLFLRVSVVLLLTAALVGPVVTWKNYAKYVVCAVDVSGSVPENAWKNTAFPDASSAQRGNQCVFLPFARTPGIMQNSTDFLSFSTDSRSSAGCDPNATNLAAALGAAAALAPEDFVPEVVLYTDRTSNLGPVPTCASRSVPVHVVQCPTVGGSVENSTENSTENQVANQTGNQVENQTENQAETWIERFSTPVSAYSGEVVGMDLFVHTTCTVGELKIDLERNGELVETQTLVFEKPGVRGVRFQVPVVEKAGAKQPLVEWRAVIHPPKEFDLLPQNDAVSAVTRIVPHERILLVERSENLGDMLRNVLKKEFIEVEICVPENMPTEIEPMKEYGLIILSNIPVSRIPAGTLDVLKTYVSETGGGLLVIGGDQAFTSGGYRSTPIEELLPVLCIEDENRPREGLALALVVDRSGSMEGAAISLARDAVKGAINVLGPQDQVGVHIYADTSQWIAPLRPLTEKNKAQAFEYIDKITAKSGTNMNLALEKASRALAEVSAPRKHIIVMTDGISIPADFMATARKIHEAGITISTIALGKDAEPNLLADIAKMGEGNAYVCINPETLPQIFTVETASAAKIGIVEGRTPVKQISSIPGFLNFNFTRVPPLLGYVQTLAKPESRVIFASESDDPILAWRKVGRGKVVAFTSDMESPQWLQTWRGGWNDFDRFWGRLIAHAIRKDALRDFRIETAFQGDWLQVTLTVPNGAVLDSVPQLALTESSTENPDENPANASNTETFELLPVAPGVFGTRTKVEPMRTYDLRLTATVEGAERTWNATTLRSFADEYLPNRQTDAGAALENIVSETHGSFSPDVASLFPTSKPTEETQFVLQTLQFWRFFLLLAVAVWLVEMGLRRAKS